MLFLLAIPKCLLIFKENFYYTSIYRQDEREELIERVKGTQRGGEFEAADDDEKLATILDGACKERRVRMAIRKMWKKRFV